MPKSSPAFFSRRSDDADSERPTILHQESHAIFRQVYRDVCEKLQFVLSSQHCNTVLFSSDLYHSQKSITAANLAITLAQQHTRVLLIDGDWHHPHLHKFFTPPTDEGFSGILAGVTSASRAISTQVDGYLHVLGSGAVPPGGDALLRSPHGRKVMAFFQDKYDYVFIDVPPIRASRDALFYDPETCGIALVVQQSYTFGDSLQNTLEAIEDADFPLIGAILASPVDSLLENLTPQNLLHTQRSPSPSNQTEPKFFSKDRPDPQS